MAKELFTEIHINAKPEQVWSVLTNFENYPAWNPFIVSLSGEVAVGNTIEAKIQPPGGSAMVFRPKVLDYEANKIFRWKGNLWVPGLFDGAHKFELLPQADGSTIFQQSEMFTGILVPLFSKMLDTKTKAGFELMNQRLKAMVEQQIA